LVAREKAKSEGGSREEEITARSSSGRSSRLVTAASVPVPPLSIPQMKTKEWIYKRTSKE